MPLNLFTRGHATEQPVPPAATLETELLEDRLRKIDQRIAALEIELPRAPTNGPQHAELLAEQADLETIRRMTDLRLRALTQAPSDKQLRARQRRAALVAKREKEIAEDFMRMSEKWQREGDYVQARLARMSSLSAREQAEKEFERVR